MWVLGVNPEFHDSAACLVDGEGRVVAFCEEERLNRRRHSFFRSPELATRLCLQQAGISWEEIDAVAVGWDSDWIDWRGDEDGALWRALGWEGPLSRVPQVIHVPHHRAHALGAFHGSGFERAGVLVVDGNGERESTTIWECRRGAEPRLLRSWPISQSLGYAYYAASHWLGFSPFDAGKTMGLAAYGRARDVEALPLVELESGDYRLLVGDPAESETVDLRERRLQHKRITRAWKQRFSEIAGTEAPSLQAPDLQGDPTAVKVAHAVQTMVERTVTFLAALTRELTGVEELCLAGGVALNCSTNGQLPGPLYVPPVPHDSGVALGAAWAVSPPRQGEQLSPYLGSDVGVAEGPIPNGETSRRDWEPELVAQLLLEGCVGGLVEGRAEVGPRALCHRSLIALPRPIEVRHRLNAIKHREKWRPFGPVALADSATGLWEAQGALHDYMLGAAPVTDAGRAAAPAVVHVDGTTRPQRVGRDGGKIAALLQVLEHDGHPGVLINTSFNDRGEPIVDSADDALRTFQAMDLDFLVLDEDVLIRRR
jgi:carbamoyltransferase